MVTSTAAHPAGAVHGQRQAAAVTGRRSRTPRSLQRAAAAAPAAAAGPPGRRRRCTVPSASPATGGRNRITVPARPTSMLGRAGQRPRPDHPEVVLHSGHLGAQRAQPGRHQLGVARPQRVPQGAGADRDRGEHEGPRRHRLRAGQADDLTDRPRGRRRQPVGAGRGQYGVGHAPILPLGRRSDGRSAALAPVRVAWRHVWPVRLDPELDRPGDAVRRARHDRGRARAGLQPRADRPGADRAPLRIRAAAGSSPSARWGLVPAWSADARGGARMINARAETVATSKAFAASFARRRCLVPADGWYEWAARPSRRRRKQPYFMTRPDGEPLVFGGIWSTWGTQSAQLLTFSVITLPAAGELARVHDRMPLVLDPSRWPTGRRGSMADRRVGAAASAGRGLRCRHRAAPGVRCGVGDVRNDGPDLIVRITETCQISPLWRRCFEVIRD